MNNTLQNIKIRKPSFFDESVLNKQLLKSQYLNEIQLLSKAWVENPRLCSDPQKRKFLSEMSSMAKTIGVADTVQHLLPCIVNAFNSDEVIHQDLYDAYVQLLFTNLPAVLDFLEKDIEKKNLNPSRVLKKGESKESVETLSDASSDQGSSLNDGDSSPRMNSYQGLSDILFDELYF